MPEQSFYLPSWQRTIEAIEDDPGVVMTLGAPDSGKTTWIGSAVVQLGRRKCLPLAVVDADLGQTTLGPPATVALGLLQDIPHEGMTLNTFPSCALYFVGSVSPKGHLLPTLVGCTRLVERAKQLGAQVVLLDTSGFVTPGAGFQLKLRKIELLDPKHLIAFQREAELEPLLSVVSRRKGVHLHRLEVSASVRGRSPAERCMYRAKRFADYFADAHVLSITLENRIILRPPIRQPWSHSVDIDVLPHLSVLKAASLRGILIGLNNSQNETLGLGLVEGVHESEDRLLVRTPVKDMTPVQILQLGSLCLTHSWQEVDFLHERF